MYELTYEIIAEFMQTKKKVEVEKIEVCKGAKRNVYLVNENYVVEYKANSNYLPSSLSTNYQKRITGRKISKREYKFYKELYENNYLLE